MGRVLLLITLGLIIYVGFFMRNWWADTVDTAQQINTVMRQVQECGLRHAQEMASQAQSSDFYGSFSDVTAYQVYMESQQRRAEAECIEESGFKDFAVWVIDQADTDDATKARMRTAVYQAKTFEEIERISEMME